VRDGGLGQEDGGTWGSSSAGEGTSRASPAEEDVAVVGVEVAELLLGQASEFLALQHEALHAVQVLVPLLHQLLRLRPQVLRQPATTQCWHPGRTGRSPALPRSGAWGAGGAGRAP